MAFLRGLVSQGRDIFSETSQRAASFHEEKCATLDAIVIGVGGTALGAELSSAILDTSLQTGASIAGASLGLAIAAEAGSNWLEDRYGTAAKVGGYVGAYTIGGLILQGVVHDSSSVIDFVSNLAHNSLDYGIIFGLGLGAKYIIQKAWTNLRRHDWDSEQTAKFKRQKTTYLAAAALAITIGEAATFSQDTFPFPTDSYRHEDVGMQILANGLTGDIHEGDLITLDVKVTHAPEHIDDNLTVRYFMADATRTLPKQGSSSFYDHLVYLGERSDLQINKDGKGIVSGFFEYDPTLAMAYVDGIAFINPTVDGAATKRLLVELWDGDKKLDHKWYGTDNSHDWDSHFIVPENSEAPTVEPAIVYIKGDGKKKVFIYNQMLGSTEMEAETLAVADYWHPHMFEFYSSRTTTIGIKQRVSEKLEKRILEKAHAHNVKVLPMVSAFTPGLVDRVLDNPETSARAVAQQIKENKYDGVAIDLETIAFGNERSEDLVRFMKVLRKQLPEGKYEIAIAVSPRFEGSETHGYRHHGFYDYAALEPHIDYVHIMAYDFHRGKHGASPVLPNNKIDDIVRYAQQHINDDDKIVFLMPFYGYVWTKSGRGVGTLSAENNQKYLNSRISSSYDEGELRVVTRDRIAYLQDSKVFETRLTMLDDLGITCVGGWRQTHATAGIFKEIGEWKSE